MSDSRAIARLALPILKSLKAREAAYEESVNEWYSSGEGRSPRWVEETNEFGHVRMVNLGGNGYRYPECIHGASLWTDYDNICGGCESGQSVYEIALIHAGYAWRTFQSRMQRIRTMDSRYDELPNDIRLSLINWACEPINEITKGE